MIPDIYADHIARVGRPEKPYIHYICVLTRIIIGILVINKTIPIKILLLFSLSVVIIFLAKYFKLPNVWKVYARTIFVYGIVGLLALKYGEEYRNIYGTLIIVDALMGLQARHIFDRLGLLIK